MSRPSTGKASPANQTHHQTTFSTLNTTLSPVHSHEEHENFSQRHEESRTRHAAIPERFHGFPNDRLAMISRAFSDAKQLYVGESSHAPTASAFFEHAINRALRDLVDTTLASRSAGLSFSYEDLEDVELTDLIRNMKLVIASQKEEIECLRRSVKELVIEIGSEKNFATSPTIPGEIKINNSSSETRSDVGIFRRNGNGTTSTSEDEVEEGYSHLFSSIGQNRSNVSSGYHIEPEGKYMTDQNVYEVSQVKKKQDPPSSFGNTNIYLYSVSSGGSDYGFLDHEQESSPFERHSTIIPNSSHHEQGAVHREPPDINQASSFPRNGQLSPARDRAKNIVLERRRRYQYFRKTHGNGVNKSKTETATALLITRSPRCAESDDVLGNQVSKFQPEHTTTTFLFREDELTLMETIAKKGSDDQ